MESTTQKHNAVANTELDFEYLGKGAVRYGLVLVLAWIGAMKFTAYEAEAIRGLVENSPLLSWTYSIFGTRSLATLIGITELTAAVLIGARRFSAKLTVVGGAVAVGTFATTLSFLLSTPGVWEETLGSFPALSVMPGQFLIKDVVLLTVAVWIFGEAWHHRNDG
jgi:uncharacterized membrane protein YkgB